MMERLILARNPRDSCSRLEDVSSGEVGDVCGLEEVGGHGELRKGKISSSSPEDDSQSALGSTVLRSLKQLEPSLVSGEK